MTNGRSINSQFLYVRRLFVEGLFGDFTYDLRLDNAQTRPATKLLILYGDNGSGKTTLLRMVFHLLNPGRRQGHRSFLAKTLFRRLVVELGEDVTVVAERHGSNLKGSFRMSIHDKGRTSEIDWVAREGGGVLEAEQGDEHEESFMAHLATLAIALYFLADNRRIYTIRSSEQPDFESRERAITLRHGRMHHLGMSPQEIQESAEESRARLLESSLRRASNWITRQVISASSKGEEDANAIYADIVRRIAAVKRTRRPEKRERSKAQLIDVLRKQELRVSTFARYGLIAPANVGVLTDSIRDAGPEALAAIESVITPYIEGVEARLNALEPTHETLDSFISILNSFYRHKSVTFDLRTGLKTITASGGSLAPVNLSSGEGQLLVLFCNLLVARHQNSIFIVDEPELSLNVKWQRELVRSLLSLAADSPIQFILATHSIELLSRHKEFVVKLTDTTQHQSV